jgi:hypothetical protein
MDDMARMFLILGHLAALIAAAVGVAFGDYALLGRRDIQHGLLTKASNGVAFALLGLWLTGLGIIWVDTHFELALLMAKPKLLAKISVVVLISLNGVLLHSKVLPSLKHAYATRRAARRAAAFATRVGAISAACWAFGIFLGVAKPLAPILGYVGFMSLFGVVVFGALLVSWRMVYPDMAERLLRESRQRRAADSVRPKPATANQPGSGRNDLDGTHISAA